MLKHLPEQLVPFEDSGFARTPEYPLLGDDITLACFCDGGQAPRLAWSVDGADQPEPVAERVDATHWRFALGRFDRQVSITYGLSAGDERLGPFHCAVGRVERFERLTRVIRTDTGLHALLAGGLCLSFERGETLRLSTHPSPPEGEELPEASLDLGEGWTLTVGGASLWSLKRFSDPKIDGLGLSARLLPDGGYSHLSLEARLHARHIWGTGERFDRVDQQGLSPSTRVVELFTRQGSHSYIPQPFFMTEAGFGWYREGPVESALHFGDPFTLTQEVQGQPFTQDHLLLGAPGDLLSQYIALTGHPTLPPDWAFGLWISANGWSSQRDVEEQLDMLRRHDYPASVMVLEAWSDERTFYQWNGGGRWPDPAGMIRRIREAGLHLLLWQIPIIKHEWEGQPGEQLLADEAEAIGKGYVIKNADGSPYRISDKWFHWSLMLDFTNPEARAWWFGKRQHLLDSGVEGFKTDGGEFLFDKRARLHDGSRGLAAHNLYPGQYIGAYQDWMRENDLQPLTFSRAGFTGAQTQPLHWAGDQLSTFDELRAQLTAGLSAGLSGLIFWGFDIGGFAGELPTAELYLRATALACFCPVMQWHAEPRSGQFYGTHAPGFNNDRSPWNLADRLQEPGLVAACARFARLRVDLLPYLLAEARHCLDWPEDEQAQSCDDQYLLGRSLLVAPLLWEGQRERTVYLPRGRWRDWFSGEEYAGARTLHYACGLDRIPVFERLPDDGPGKEVPQCT